MAKFLPLSTLHATKIVASSSPQHNQLLKSPDVSGYRDIRAGGLMTTFERLLKAFPFLEVRDAQRSALKIIAQAYDEGTRFVIIEAPTGSGKSGIAIAVTDTLNGYVLTPQKMLTRQYVAAFSHVRELRGRANYKCTEHPTNCEQGGEIQSELSFTACNNCPYQRDKKRFTEAQSSVTSFAYLLSERSFVGELSQRPALVLDEAHNTEELILSQIDFHVTKKRAGYLGVVIPHDIAGGQAAQWIKNDLLGAVMSYSDNQRHNGNRKALKMATDLIRRIEFFLKRDDFKDWLLWTDNEGFHAKPLNAARYAEPLLFSAASQMVVILSATILNFDVFRRGLGIADSYVELRLPCDFAPQNRPIYFLPCGSMSKGAKNMTLPIVARQTAKLLQLHKDQKGIIHGHSKVNCDQLKLHLPEEQQLRLLTYEGSEEKDATIVSHSESAEPTVLLAQGMAEGLDLKDDLSRFQVILKVPYPYLGNKYIKERMEIDYAWFIWLTALKLIQSTGRSIRSRDDYAETYVLDSDFKTFVGRARNILPQWWYESIVWEPKKKLPTSTKPLRLVKRLEEA
jgi:ATP-dependent DNA helicase DinG